MEKNKYLLAHCMGNYGDISYTLLAEISNEEDGKQLGEKMKEIIYDDSKDMNEELMTLFIDRYNKFQYKTYYLTVPALSGNDFHIVHESDNNDDLFSYTDYINYTIV